MTDLDVVTGEIVPAGPNRLTPEGAAAWGQWVRDLMRSALTEGVDYGVIPGTGTKPTMYKSGGEMLLKAAGLGFTMARIDDDDARQHSGITYRCTVLAGDIPVAVCDGYCGHDEPAKRSANWNTIVKIAQKRALVGAALNATASSGLFNADLDDDAPDPVKVNDPPVLGDDVGFLNRAIAQLSDQGVDWVDAHGIADQIPTDFLGGGFRRSHRDRLAWHILVAQLIKPKPPDPEAA